MTKAKTPEQKAASLAKLKEWEAKRKAEKEELYKLHPELRKGGGATDYSELMKRLADARIERFVELIRSGHSRNKAQDILGIASSTVDAWYKKRPGLQDRVAAARLEAQGKGLSVTRHKNRAHTPPAPDSPYTDTSFAVFRHTYFDRDTPPHHALVVEALERAKPGEIVLVLGFPGMGKSSVLVDYVNRGVALDPNLRFAIISEGQDLARKILGQIADRMTNHDRFGKYIGAYGPFKTPTDKTTLKRYVGRETGTPWTADYLRVFKADHDEKEMTVESKGVGSKLYGGRYDSMIYDDLQSTQNLGATAKILSWLRQDALTRPGHADGGHIFLGSRVGRGDLYETMKDEGMVDRTVVIPALDRWVDREDMFTVRGDKIVLNPDCPAKPTWDAWTLASLAQRRKKVGEAIWSRTYMQREHDGNDTTFTEAMIERAKDRQFNVGDSRGTYTVLSVDPALDTGLAAFAVADCSADALHLRDLVVRGDLRRYEDIYAQIASLAATYRPNVLVVEQNNFQRGMLQDDRLLAMASRFGFRIEPHQTSRNKHDPVMGVAMMASAFVDGEIRLPWGNAASVEKMGVLCDELRNWTPTRKGAQLKQDTVMALWFAWKQWESVRRVLFGTGMPLQRNTPSWMHSNRRGIA